MLSSARERILGTNKDVLVVRHLKHMTKYEIESVVHPWFTTMNITRLRPRYKAHSGATKSSFPTTLPAVLKKCDSITDATKNSSSERNLDFFTCKQLF